MQINIIALLIALGIGLLTFFKLFNKARESGCPT